MGERANTTVLVTGGSGRLGRSVVTGLAEAGYDVVSVDRAPVPEGGFSAQVRQEAADLMATGVARSVIGKHRPDVVIHLAAIAVPFSAPEDVILQTNSQLAFQVMGAATDLGVGRIITASSPTVLGYGSPVGWVPDALPLDEQTTPKPWNAYALSKLLAEQTMRMFAAAQGDRIRYAAFRPCYVISPEEWAGAPTQQGHTVIERLENPALSAAAVFNYVDARDVADFLDVLMRSMHRIPNAETFFVGAADAMARKPLSELIPLHLPALAHLAGDLHGSSPAFSIDKARRMLGWEPRRSWRTELPGRTAGGGDSTDRTGTPAAVRS